MTNKAKNEAKLFAIKSSIAFGIRDIKGLAKNGGKHWKATMFMKTGSNLKSLERAAGRTELAL